MHALILIDYCRVIKMLAYGDWRCRGEWLRGGVDLAPTVDVYCLSINFLMDSIGGGKSINLTRLKRSVPVGCQSWGLITNY